MSRYLREQCAWLLALLPVRAGQQTLARFGWPAVSASEVRAKGEALGAELDEREQRGVAALQAAAALRASHVAIRHPAQGGWVYAASSGLRYCTRARDPQTAKLIWRELKAAAVYEVVPTQRPEPAFLAQGYQAGSGLAESACTRFGTDRMKGAGMRWSLPGAQEVATLRILLLSDRWQEVADHCRAAA